jgi:hypothetical protein
VNISGAELKRLAPALAMLVLLAAGGAAMIWYADRSLKAAQAALANANTDRAQNQERLSKIAEEERDVKEKLEVYRRLKEARVLGEERRLEWADTVTRIRKERELLDVRYRVEPQRVLASLPGKPAPVDFYFSTMKVTLALLHEGDLFAFLDDLRASGNAYYSVQRCALVRTGQSLALTTLAPRLRAECSIDLITIMDRAAKS